MNPQQAAGRAHIAGPRSDVYLLRVALYEMLVGVKTSGIVDL